MAGFYEQEYYPPSFFALVCGRELVLLVHIVDDIARFRVGVIFDYWVGKKSRKKTFRLILAGNSIVWRNLLFESQKIWLN